MHIINLRRSDFKTVAAEANYFEDFVLEPLGIPCDQISAIESVEITVAGFEATRD